MDLVRPSGDAYRIWQMWNDRNRGAVCRLPSSARLPPPSVDSSSSSSSTSSFSSSLPPAPRLTRYRLPPHLIPRRTAAIRHPPCLSLDIFSPMSATARMPSRTTANTMHSPPSSTSSSPTSSSMPPQFLQAVVQKLSLPVSIPPHLLSPGSPPRTATTLPCQFLFTLSSAPPTHLSFLSSALPQIPSSIPLQPLLIFLSPLHLRRTLPRLKPTPSLPQHIE